MPLTSRMENWIHSLGIHIATSDQNGYPRVIVVNSADVDGDYVNVTLTAAQVDFIQNNIKNNHEVAIAPGQIGAIRAPYQLKGKASLEGNKLSILISEIYCTKPGYEAGIRLDTLGFDAMKDFDESRWTDLAPEGK